VPQAGAQFLARGFQLAPDAPHAARPGVLAQRVDHRAANATLGERLELDAARVIKTMRRVDQPDDAVLHQVAEIDRMRHGRRHSTRERLNKRQSRFDSVGVTGGGSGSFHVACPKATGVPRPYNGVKPS